MDSLLRFKNDQASLSYIEGLEQGKASDRRMILIIFIVSTVYYLIDIIASTYAIYDGHNLTFGEMLMTFTLQFLKIVSFFAFYKLKAKTENLHAIIEIIYGVIFIASVISIWHIQLKTDDARAYIVGLEAAWTFFFIDIILNSWRLKVPIMSSVMVFGIVKTYTITKSFSIDYIQAILQLVFIGIILYSQEKKKEKAILSKFYLTKTGKSKDNNS